MTRALEQKTVNVMLDIPVRRCSELSHTKNINYCIDQIKAHGGGDAVVVSFLVERTALGTWHNYHRLLSKETAEKRRTEDHRFQYRTLEDFANMLREIELGRYVVEGGQIVGLSPEYQQRLHRELSKEP